MLYQAACNHARRYLSSREFAGEARKLMKILLSELKCRKECALNVHLLASDLLSVQSMVEYSQLVDLVGRQPKRMYAILTVKVTLSLKAKSEGNKSRTWLTQVRNK